MQTRRKTSLVLIVAALSLAAPTAMATHDGTQWFSSKGLADTGIATIGTPPSPGFGLNFEHGGPDGPAEPNFGHSRPGGDRNADGTALGSADTDGQDWGNREYVPTCVKADPLRPGPFDATPGIYFEKFLDAYTQTPEAFIENVGDIVEARDGDENGPGGTPDGVIVASWNATSTVAAGDRDTSELVFDDVWFWGIPVGVNVNGVLKGVDAEGGVGDGTSDYAQNGPFQDGSTAPRIWVASQALPAFNILWFGDWVDGADNINGVGSPDNGDRDGVINIAGINVNDALTTNDANDEWRPYQDAEDRMFGFFDPYNFVGVDPDPNGDLGDALDNIDQFVNSQDPNDVTEAATDVVDYLTGLDPNDVFDIDPSVDCEIEKTFLTARNDGRYDSAFIYFIDDVPGRRVTTTVWFDPDSDYDLDELGTDATRQSAESSTTGDDTETDDRVDIDQYCTYGFPTGVDVVIDPAAVPPASTVMLTCTA